MTYSSQKGVSLFLAIIILTIILAIVLGLSTILVGQIKTIRELGHSVIALYAADTGVERVIQIAFSNSANLDNTNYINQPLDNGSKYNVEVRCCTENPEGSNNCKYREVGAPPCPIANPLPVEPCKASYYCISSVGTFENTKRAIKVEI